jgi:cytidylate kinase
MGIVIAIDGPAGAGKGTLGRALAAETNYAYLDTGLIYRAVAFLTAKHDVDPDDHPACAAIARSLTPADLAETSLRSEAIGQLASRLSAIPSVRLALNGFQQEFATNPPDAAGAILDGRDIGTVICPGADLKIYLTADLDIRARRRKADAPVAETLEAISASMKARDQRETERAMAPMKPADDAVIIDCSCLTPGAVLARVMDELTLKLNSFASSRPI